MSIAACSLQPEDEQLSERDCRPVSDKEEPDYTQPATRTPHLSLWPMG